MIIRHWRSLFVFFIWAILLGTPANMAAQNYSYGINSDFQRPEQGTKISELGAGFARFTLYWNEFEPTKGDYQWYIMNNNVTEASNRNIQLFVTLGERSPGWAAPCQACAPYNWQDWYDFVYTVALNYPSVQYWGMWNEPDNTGNWASGFQAYGTLLNVGRGALNAANPSALLVGPESGEGGVDRDGWYQNVMSAYGIFIDVVSVHWYHERTDLWDFMENWVRPSAGGKPIWLTEVGWTACTGNFGQEVTQGSGYGDALTQFDPRRSWWTKIFFYRLWDNLTCGEAIVSADFSYNKVAFGVYRDWIIDHP